MANFAMIGAGGYIAPRHMKAIQDTGNKLVAATDTKDSVGIMDRYFPEARFFTEIERFDRHLEKLRRANPAEKVDYVSVCSPNYLHDAHVRLAMRVNAHAICEKPLVINPWNVDALHELEQEFDRRIYTVLQLRYIDSLKKLKQDFESQKNRKVVDIDLTYVTARGQWYLVSWKGDAEKSGGIALNIGIHFFDLLQWLFGKAQNCELHLNQPQKMAGYVEFDWARVRWFLSVDREDLPQTSKEQGKPAFRSMTIDGKELEFSDGFTDLHTVVYQEILDGRGYGIAEARPSIELVHRIRSSDLTLSPEHKHPKLSG